MNKAKHPSISSPAHRRQNLRVCAGAALLALLAAELPAATLYWDGDGTGVVGGGAGVWSTAFAGWSTSPTGNTYQVWNNAAAPADDAWFANTAGAVTLVEPSTVRSITSRINGYTLSGATLTLAGGTGVFDIGTASTVVFTVNSEIAGSTGLTKTGAGQLTLGAANSFTGGATITQGTVNIGHDLALSTGLVTLNGGAIAAVGAPRTLANSVTLAANTTVSGSQALTFSGPVTLTGNRSLSVSTASVLVTLAGGLAETGGPRSFTKGGNGNLLLSAASTYTGATTISAGTLALGPAGSISAGNLSLNGGVLALGSDFTRSLGAGADQIRFTANGGFAAYGGPVNITGLVGTPEWGVTTNFLATGRTLILGSAIANDVVTWTNDFSLGSAARVITVNDNTTSTADRAVISGVISSAPGGALTRNGAGRLDLTGANTYSGPTLLQRGVTAITTLANIGAGPSSLGAPATIADGTIGLGVTTTAATLLYLGTGSTTDRALDLAGTTGGATIQADGTGPLVFTGGVTATGAGSKTLTLTGLNTGANELGGVIADHSATHVTRVTKSGAGTWKISGANTYTGVTTLSAGTLVAASNTAFGASTLTLSGSGATLRADASPRTLANSVTLSANTTLGGTSDLTFTGAITHTGGNRTLTVSNTGLTTFSGPTLTLAENNQARTLTLSPGTDSTLVVSSIVRDGTGTGADRLTKSGVGTLVLSGNNTHTGGTTLTAGTLVAASNTAFGTGTLTLSGGTLRADASPRTFANPVALTVNTTLGGASDLTFTGELTHTGGSRTLTVANTGLTTFSGPTLTLAENNQTRTLTLSPAADSTLVVSSVVRDGAGSGADRLAKSGAGTLVLSGANTHTGGTTLSAGVLVAASDTAFGTGTLTLSGGTLRADASPRTFANPVSLSANSTLGGASALTFTGPLALGSTTRTLAVANTGLTTFSGVASGTAGLTKTGAGTLALSGLNTFTGVTSIQAGVLSVNSLANLSAPSALGAPTTTSRGTIALGATTSAGTLRYTGSGHSTNRVVNLAGTTGGATIQADGTGPLVFTTAFRATGAGAKTLVLSGANTDANTVAAAIVNNSAANRTTVRKQGSGTWVLSGANTFTGGLVVESGVLRLGANNTLADTLPLTLSGGVIEVSGRTETAGVLAVTGPALIDFGASAAAIVFAASNSTSWAGATLTIANYTVGTDTLRFGANASALTSAQLASFRFADYGNVSARIDALGFVSPVPEPSSLAILGGLGALLVTATRRPRRRVNASA